MSYYISIISQKKNKIKVMSFTFTVNLTKQYIPVKFACHVTHIYSRTKKKVLKYQVTFGNLIEKNILIEIYVNLNDLNMFCVDKSDLYILIMDWEHDNIYLISICLHCTTASQYFSLLYFFNLYTLLLGIVLDQILLPLKSIYQLLYVMFC